MKGVRLTAFLEGIRAARAATESQREDIEFVREANPYSFKPNKYGERGKRSAWFKGFLTASVIGPAGESA